MVVHSSTAPATTESPGGGVGTCSICHDTLDDGVTADCSHTFCRTCITEYLETSSGVPCCLACRKPITIDLARAPQVCPSRTTLEIGIAIHGAWRSELPSLEPCTSFYPGCRAPLLRRMLFLRKRRACSLPHGLCLDSPACF